MSKRSSKKSEPAIIAVHSDRDHDGKFIENFLSEMDDKGKGDFDFDSSWCQSERGDRRSLRSGPRHSPHVHGIH